MPDYTLAIGEHAPYGFSSADDGEAARHAASYILERHGAERASEPDLALTLAGPGGVLTGPDEGLRDFCDRVGPVASAPSGVDDVRTGDPVTPDCNAG